MASLMLPTFDGTLGCLFIGSSLAAILYGVTCVQTFIYVTSDRTKHDSLHLWLVVLINLCV
ncbi:hypothetical protein F5878DRAFT_635458 [Lentinula raphanica]|uniref:Uncharacterized protein n=1 Tax=Lentinula raphanica TaxID=153919 RepID=A0AA38NX02_9AGAR|nr:hypothetical protein F5878DRAFT_635458 [Lentinula raphanica]